MADTVTVRNVFVGPRMQEVKMTCISDGTGETLVTKIDISTWLDGAGRPATYSAIDEIKWGVHNFDSVRLYWDHTADDPIYLIPGNTEGEMSWVYVGGLVDPRTAGGTGDILLTTAGAQAGATYDITIRFRPKA